MVIGMELKDSDPTKMEAKAYFNGKPYHAQPIAVSFLYTYFN